MGPPRARRRQISQAQFADRQKFFEDLADKRAAHATVEEQIFYPSVMHAKTSELLRESIEEHLAIKRVQADTLALDLEASQIVSA